MEKHRKALTVTVAEAARLLGVGRNLAYEAVKRGEIPTIRIGRRILVPVEGINRLLSEAQPGSRATARRAERRLA
jgi:excisionase family DNA binding protein